MSDTTDKDRARFGLMTERDVHARVEAAFAGKDAEMVELLKLFAVAPTRMDYLMVRLGLDVPMNLSAQLAELRRYVESQGEERLLRRLRREQWKAMQENDGASTTAREILDSVDR